MPRSTGIHATHMKIEDEFQTRGQGLGHWGHLRCKTFMKELSVSLTISIFQIKQK